jgi:hypothetical protein
MGLIRADNGYMKKKPEVPSGEIVPMKIFISREIADRIEAYAQRISGGKRPNVTAVIRGWIMEKLPEAEAALGEKKEA